MKLMDGSHEREFLLLSSYCGTDNDACTDRRPCPDCLAMCNVFDASGDYARLFDPHRTPAPVESGVVEKVRKYCDEYEDSPYWGGPTRYPDPPKIADLRALLALATSGEVTEAMIEAGFETMCAKMSDPHEASRELAEEVYLAMCAAQVGG